MITWWDKTTAWFKDSMTILWARIQYVGGIIAAGLVAAFSGYGFHATDEHGRQERIQDALRGRRGWRPY